MSLVKSQNAMSIASRDAALATIRSQIGITLERLATKANDFAWLAKRSARNGDTITATEYLVSAARKTRTFSDAKGVNSALVAIDRVVNAANVNVNANDGAFDLSEID